MNINSYMTAEFIEPKFDEILKIYSKELAIPENMIFGRFLVVKEKSKLLNRVSKKVVLDIGGFGPYQHLTRRVKLSDAIAKVADSILSGQIAKIVAQMIRQFIKLQAAEHIQADSEEMVAYQTKKDELQKKIVENPNDLESQKELQKIEQQIVKEAEKMMNIDIGDAEHSVIMMIALGQIDSPDIFSEKINGVKVVFFNRLLSYSPEFNDVADACKNKMALFGQPYVEKNEETTLYDLLISERSSKKYENMGDFYFSEQRYNDAATYYQIAMHRNPDNKEALVKYQNSKEK